MLGCSIWWVRAGFILFWHEPLLIYPSSVSDIWRQGSCSSSHLFYFTPFHQTAVLRREGAERQEALLRSSLCSTSQQWSAVPLLTGCYTETHPTITRSTGAPKERWGVLLQPPSAFLLREVDVPRHEKGQAESRGVALITAPAFGWKTKKREWGMQLMTESNMDDCDLVEIK